MSELPESLVRDCPYNWLGYGSLGSPYWFIGIEESLYRWDGFDNVDGVEENVADRLLDVVAYDGSGNIAATAEAELHPMKAKDVTHVAEAMA